MLLDVLRRRRDVVIGDGIDLGDIYAAYPRIRRLAMSDADRTQHWITFGTTGCGKTRLLEHLVAHDIRRGHNVCVIDPKGDQDLLAKIVETAAAVGRSDELRLITPAFPTMSMKINPLASYYRPEEIVQHIVAGLPMGKEPFFAEVAKEVLLVAVFGHILLHQRLHGRASRPCITLADLRQQVSRKSLDDLHKLLVEYTDDPEIQEISVALEAIVNSPPDYFSKVTTSLRTTLSQLSLGSIGAVVGHETGNEFLDHLAEGRRMILVAQTGSLMFRDPALILARVFLSMLQAMAGRLYADGQRFTPPLMLYIDEASNVIYPGLEDLFNKARGVGIAIHAYTQSIADINARIGEDRARVILDNCNTQLFFKVNDPITSGHVAKLAGVRTRYVPMFDPELKTHYRATDEPVVDEAAAVRLRPRQFFCFRHHEAIRGRTCNVIPAKSKIQWPMAADHADPATHHPASLEWVQPPVPLGGEAHASP